MPGYPIVADSVSHIAGVQTQQRQCKIERAIAEKDYESLRKDTSILDG